VVPVVRFSDPETVKTVKTHPRSILQTEFGVVSGGRPPQSSYQVLQQIARAMHVYPSLIRVIGSQR